MKKPKSPYLEYIAGFASRDDQQSPENSAMFSRLIRYYQQSLARQLLPGEKVAKCARAIRPNKSHVEVVHVPDTSKAYFRNLIICGRVWTCPVCAAKVNERRRKELAMLIYTAGYRPVLVTYTIQHQRRDRLHTLMSAIRTAMRSLKSGRGYQGMVTKFGIVGDVRGIEITYGSSGWHPHVHEIVLMAGDTTDEQIDEFERWLRDRWQAALKKVNRAAAWEIGVSITKHNGDIAEYIAKFGREPANQGWTITHEVAKSNAKAGKKGGRTPFELLIGYGEGNNADGFHFREYAQVTKNIHPLHWSAGLRALLKNNSTIETDEELASADPDPYVVLANIEPSAWKLILSHDRRAELLNIASAGDKAAVTRWLEKQGITHIDVSAI